MTVINLCTKGTSGLYPVSYNNRAKRNYFSGDNSSDFYTPSQDYIKRRIAVNIAGEADIHLRMDRYAEAKDLYIRAIAKKQDYTPSYFGLAKVYRKENNLPKAIETYDRLLKILPEDNEALTLKGNCLKDTGEYEKAKQCFETVYKKDPKYDFATRSLKEINNNILASTNPILARIKREQQADKNLRAALSLIINYGPPSLIDKLQNVTYTFDKTSSLSGHQNIAQYEHRGKKVTVKEDYRWAAPEIVAAYIVHEDIHAGDNDSYTSVREEQDAYEQSVIFWIKHNNGVKDPELDYAAELYKESPKKLESKVAEIYRTRDKDIPDYSPGHRPLNASSGEGFFNSFFRAAGTALGLN